MRTFHKPHDQANRIRQTARQAEVSRRTLPKREVDLSKREVSASYLENSCSTVPVPHLHDFRAGPSFDAGANIAPNCLGGWNDLENSEDCRSAGGHGNQHVRLRGAQIDRIKTICPAPAAIVASSRAGVALQRPQSVAPRSPRASGVQRTSTWRSGQVAPSPADIRPCPGVYPEPLDQALRWLAAGCSGCGRVSSALLVDFPFTRCLRNVNANACKYAPGGDPVLCRAVSGLCAMPKGIDTEHLFGFMIGTDVGNVGEREFQSETTGRFGKNGGNYRAVGQRVRTGIGARQEFSNRSGKHVCGA